MFHKDECLDCERERVDMTINRFDRLMQVFRGRNPEPEIETEKSVASSCNHFNSYARDFDLRGTFYCPSCDRALSRAESVNLKLELLRLAAGIKSAS